MVLNAQEQLLKAETLDSDELAYYGNTVLTRTEKPVSMLVKPTETTDSVSISINSLGSAAVAFTNMSSMLQPSLFKTATNTLKTMMSNVVSATLPKTTNTQLTTPVSFTLRHTAEIGPNSVLSRVYWNNTHWIGVGCSNSRPTAATLFAPVFTCQPSLSSCRPTDLKEAM
ncbi:hypothetical protein AOLI_G00234780 [Acnodon oligacanthus]